MCWKKNKVIENPQFIQEDIIFNKFLRIKVCKIQQLKSLLNP